jgi:hypothetical protein
MDGTYQVTPYVAPGAPSTGGIQIDLGVMDVPTRWFVTQSGAPALAALPGSPGYGLNPRRSVNPQGLPAGANQSNQLKSLGGLNLFDPAHEGMADGNTVFDTPIASAIIGAMVNYGVGMQQIDASALRHLSATGRLPSGENLMCVRRDSGSGTRNGFDNSLQLDPSFGVGENVGIKNQAPQFDILGPNFLPSNKGGSGDLEATVINHRLAVGHTGPERGAGGAGWLQAGKADLLAVRNDLIGGTVYARPTIDAVLHNGVNGYNIAGPETFASIGDPLAAPVSKGGDAGNTHPQMRNVEAAAYLNNITRSIASFEAAACSGQPQDTFTPGEYLATQFVLVAATDNVPDPSNPTNLVPNPNFNQGLQDCIASVNVLGNGIYQSFNTSANGLVPNRTNLGGALHYSDNVAGGMNYIDQAGNAVAYASSLTTRNRIAGDFNGDGLRNIDDAVQLVAAWKDRNGGPHWNAPDGTGSIAGAPGSDAVIEVLGDFNGDGNFDRADVRYWADGLAIATSGPNAGKLDRKAGFIAVDDAFGGNFFGTVIASGAPYHHGDSRGDVAGPSGAQARGFAPVGADGVIDINDVNYVRAQFIGNPYVTDGEANWDNISEAIGFDLSADINGDGKVNQADVDELISIIQGPCPADWNHDGVLTSQDFFDFVNSFFASNADYNVDGITNSQDFFDFLNAFFAGC